MLNYRRCTLLAVVASGYLGPMHAFPINCVRRSRFDERR